MKILSVIKKKKNLRRVVTQRSTLRALLRNKRKTILWDEARQMWSKGDQISNILGKVIFVKNKNKKNPEINGKKIKT